MTNCINCGATLHYSNNDTICKCVYCDTEYHINQEGKINEYCIELEIMGQKRKFYISELKFNKLFGSCGRNINGELESHYIATKIKMELIEM